MGERFELLERARDAVLAEAEAFRSELGPALDGALRAGIERLLERQAGHVAAMEQGQRRALEDALERAVGIAVRSVDERLRAPDVWLSPLVAPDLPGRETRGWPLDVPEWLARLLGRGSRPRLGLGSLDEPENRIWIAVASASTSVDPVLVEFGFEPATRRIGGGRFGVGPRTLARLDPSGVLRQRWRRYRTAFERYEALTRVSG